MAIIQEGNSSFETGSLVITGAVFMRMKTDSLFNAFVENSIYQFMNRDFGYVLPEDIQANRDAIRNGGRILGRYRHFTADPKDAIFIITEPDRSHTTVLFCKDY